MVVEELERRGYAVNIVTLPGRARFPLVLGLLDNVRNLFRRFRRESVLFVDHGAYRNCFLAVHFWRSFYKCRVVGLVYHLDYALMHIHGGRRVRESIEGMALRACDHILTISRSTAAQIEHLGVAPERISFMPVSRRFAPQEFIARNSNPSSVRLLFVGSIDERKGVLDAVKAIGAYRGSKRVVYVCVGAANMQRDYTQRLAAEAATIPHIDLQFAGALSHEDLAQEYRRADGFLFPSMWEGYGIAIEEAMCFGLPVIAYEAGAVNELVEDNVTGWLVPKGDVEALARAVEECVDNPAERLCRGDKGLLKIREVINALDLGDALSRALTSIRAHRSA